MLKASKTDLAGNPARRTGNADSLFIGAKTVDHPGPRLPATLHRSRSRNTVPWAGHFNQNRMILP